MYIGEFYMTDVADVWSKFTARPILLWQPGPNDSLMPALDENGNQKIVDAYNYIGTFGYKSAAGRYCAIAEINGTYWVVGADC